MDFLAFLVQSYGKRTQISKVFSVQTTRLHESFEGSNSSLARSNGKLSISAQAASGRLNAFSGIFGFWGNMRFLGHTFGSRHARRSIEGSVDTGDHVVSKTSLS